MDTVSIPEMDAWTSIDRDLDLLGTAIERRREGRRFTSSGDLVDDAVAAIEAMRLLYRSLSRRMTDTVDSRDYLAAVVAHLRRAYLADLAVKISFVGDAGEISPEAARSLGLLVVELVSLSARYGLRRQPGRITVTLLRSPGAMKLRVSDDGFGDLGRTFEQECAAFSAVQRIVAASGGRTTVRSLTGLGTSVAVTMPYPGVPASPVETTIDLAGFSTRS